MTPTLLTVGNFAGMLLEKLIAEEQRRHEIKIGVVGDRASLYSVARTLLAVRRTPVVVVLNAETPEPEAALDRQLDAEEVIGDAAGKMPYRVIVAMPALEILFFQEPSIARRIYGEAVTDHVAELAQLSPRRALQKLAKDKTIDEIRIDILRSMNADDVQALRESPLIKDLLDFIKRAAAYSIRSASSTIHHEEARP